MSSKVYAQRECLTCGRIISESAYSGSNGNFRKHSKTHNADVIEDMLLALECAETVLILLSDGVCGLGFNAKNVLPKVQAAIRKAKGEL